MMNAVIDIGNTHVKVGLFEKNSALKVTVLDNTEIREFIIENKVLKVLVGTVADNAILEEIGKTKVQLNVLGIDTPIPIATLYATPNTLGVDRLSACVGARNYTANNVLVIDAGSCITYDILTDNDEHLGGLICPGLHMRLNAMHTFTANLPLVPFKTPALIGNSTQQCLQSGASNGAIAEMKGLIEAFMEEYDNLSIIIGGGDAKFFDKNLELNTFVVPNLAVEGLHTIFKYNE